MLIENQLKKLGFGTAALFLIIVAVILGAAQMYLMALIVALVPLAGRILNSLMMRGIVCSRTAPTTADEHGRMLVTITVRNRSAFPTFYLRVLDTLPRYLRYAGNPAGESGFISELWPGQSSRIKYLVEPQRRGVHTVGPTSIVATDVFGFSELRKSTASPCEVLVYPEILPVTPELLSGGSSSGWRDEMNARRHGDGIDFAGVREYREGDALRRINWKTTARRGALVVTEFTQGFATDLVIVLDRQASSYKNSGHGPVSAFEYAVKIATALGVAALEEGSVVHLMSMADEDDVAAPMRDGAGIPRLLDRLARVEADGLVDVTRQLSRAWTAIESSSIVIVITPRGPDDPAVRAEIETLSRNPSVECVDIYWLNGSSFERVVEHREFDGSGSGVQDAPGSRVRTDFGCESRVDAQTNLPALLGGSSRA